MTGVEYLESYCKLILHGYTHDEAKDILEEIKEKMEDDKN
jgi:hypothetical protein